MVTRLQPEQEVQLLDGQDCLLGRVLVKKIEGELVIGQFAAEPAFAAVQPLFSEFVEAVNQQMFHLVDELDARIAALRLHLGAVNGVPMLDIDDVQIAGQDITFRTRMSSRDSNTEASAQLSAKSAR